MSIGDAWTNDPDLVNRDPNGINGSLQVAYEDTFGEPDDTHSSDCAWKCAFKCFNLWKLLCYRIMTTLCSWAIGCYWGCVFSYVAFCTIWCVTPHFALMETVLGCYRRVYTAYLDACVTPYYIACSNIFNAFKK